MSSRGDAELRVIRSLSERVSDAEQDGAGLRDYLAQVERELAAGGEITARLRGSIRSPRPRPASWAARVACADADLAARGIDGASMSARQLRVHMGAPDPDCEGLLLRLGPWDFAFAVAAGVAGALTSLGLEEAFSALHDGKYLESFAGWIGGDGFYEKLASKMPLDQVPGNGRYGGFWHRLDYGHDILDPFEAWNGMRAHFGGPIAAALGYLIHWTGDALSVEGLPLPGSSWARQLLRVLSGGNLENYQQFFTLKGRDVAGSALVALATNRYVAWRKQGKAGTSYLDYQVPLLAHSVAAAVGCYLGSLNWASLTAAGSSFLGLALHVRRVNRWLDSRDAALWAKVSDSQDYGPPLAQLLASIEGLDPTERAWLAPSRSHALQAASALQLRLLEGGSDE